MNAELIIFDLDGTLVDSRQDIANSVNFALKTLNLREKDVETITRFIGAGLRQTMHKALDKSHDELLDRAVELFRNYYIEHPIEHAFLYPGVKDFLKETAKTKKAVVSNKDRDICVKTLDLLGVSGHFEMIIGGDDPACRKPDPCPLYKVMKKTGASKNKTIIVGDMDLDILAGKNAGIKTCAVTYGFTQKEDLMKTNPDFMIDNIRELINF